MKITGEISNDIHFIYSLLFRSSLRRAVHILAPQATELIPLASLAMRNEIGVEELKATVYGHPTVSESFFEAALDVRGEAIHFLKGRRD